jgi:hypothetical protein
VHVLSWMGLECDDIERMRRDVVDVLGDRLRRG